jgi:hypothetical protein
MAADAVVVAPAAPAAVVGEVEVVLLWALTAPVLLPEMAVMPCSQVDPRVRPRTKVPMVVLPQWGQPHITVAAAAAGEVQLRPAQRAEHPFTAPPAEVEEVASTQHLQVPQVQVVQVD